MNQILYVQDKRSKNSIDTRKIVLFFAIAIILFGLVLLGEGIYFTYKNSINKKVTPTTPTPEIPLPTILLTQTQENKVIIHIESEIAISHLIYAWNNEASQTIEETGKTSIEEIIDLPVGQNTLNLSVIDSDGRETKEQKNFVLEAKKPVIELSVVGNNIKINITSETELSYITYRWNLEEEKREDMYTYENKNQFELTLEIPKGQNTLKIVAVDIQQNSTEKTQEIKGVTRANTSVVIKGDYLHFTVSAEENIKTVQFIFNGQSFLMNTDTFGTTNVVHYKIKLTEGMNYLKVISTTQSDVEDTSVWKYEYKPQ